VLVITCECNLTADIYVPPSQIADTSELFRIPGRRKLGLKYLAAVLLGISIQSETHDSIEDSRTALALYQKYLELQRDGIVQETLTELYRIGRNTNWQAVAGRDSIDLDKIRAGIASNE